MSIERELIIIIEKVLNDSKNDGFILNYNIDKENLSVTFTPLLPVEKISFKFILRDRSDTFDKLLNIKHTK